MILNPLFLRKVLDIGKVVEEINITCKGESLNVEEIMGWFALNVFSDWLLARFVRLKEKICSSELNCGLLDLQLK